MKLSLYFTALVNAVPNKKKPKIANRIADVPDVSCADLIANNGLSTTLNVVDNGQNGHFTIDEYANHMSCVIEFASQCTEAGVEVDITHLTVEDDNFYGDNSCFDQVAFAYKAGSDQKVTDALCGCMNDDSHPSCDLENYTYFYSDFTPAEAEDLEYTLIGTDVKMIFDSDGSLFGGKVSVQWQCAEPPAPTTASNTIEMAAAVMTGDFPPSMAIDYGCAGRGEFDAFSTTIGTPIDAVDHAFFNWKKCVQCASGSDKTVGAYDYDVADDSCGPTNRAFCECDRILINTLATSSPLSKPIPTSQCVANGGNGGAPGGNGGLTCCNWNTHYWAAYNANNSCCGEDGIKEIGSC
jgi:hypothetical protein